MSRLMERSAYHLSRFRRARYISCRLIYKTIENWPDSRTTKETTNTESNMYNKKQGRERIIGRAFIDEVKNDDDDDKTERKREKNIYERNETQTMS